jgi:predicted glycosyltransferase involved in capsule biosynthesis
MNKLSIVTVSRDRTEHLIQSSRLISLSSIHFEHIIIDWSSNIPIEINLLPNDSRIKLLRVENETEWWLTRAYNFGIGKAEGDIILKVDADVLLDKVFFDTLNVNTENICIASSFFGNNFIADSGLSGLFLIKKYYFNLVGGFNEYIRGWGYDEIDLFVRLFTCGMGFQKLNLLGVSSIEHENSKSYSSYSSNDYVNKDDFYDLLKVSNNYFNSIIAKHKKWNYSIPNSKYQMSNKKIYSCHILPEKLKITQDTSDQWLKNLVLFNLRGRNMLLYLCFRYFVPLVFYRNLNVSKLVFNHPLISIL